jgi:hypothetical protein
MLTRSLKKGNILLDRIFVMYLYITLQQAIGLKSLIAEGLTFLGTKERIVAFTLAIKPEVKKLY